MVGADHDATRSSAYKVRGVVVGERQEFPEQWKDSGRASYRQQEGTVFCVWCHTDVTAGKANSCSSTA